MLLVRATGIHTYVYTMPCVAPVLSVTQLNCDPWLCDVTHAALQLWSSFISNILKANRTSLSLDHQISIHGARTLPQALVACVHMYVYVLERWVKDWSSSWVAWVPCSLVPAYVACSCVCASWWCTYVCICRIRKWCAVVCGWTACNVFSRVGMICPCFKLLKVYLCPLWPAP